MIDWASVQAALARAGYPCGAPDEKPGPRTWTALFASAAGRTADAGIAAIGAAGAQQLVGDPIAATPARLAEFLAQTGHETGGYTRFEEDLCYSARGLAATWPARYALDPVAKVKQPNARARALAGKPQAIANDVYAGRMGNTAPADGWQYRGRGLLMLTGRAQYDFYGRLLGLDLIGNPNLGEDSATSLLIARAFWRQAQVNVAIDRCDFVDARRRTNGGTIGLDDVAARRCRLLQILA